MTNRSPQVFALMVDSIQQVSGYIGAMLYLTQYVLSINFTHIAKC